MLRPIVSESDPLYDARAMGQLTHRSTKKVVPLAPGSIAGRADGSTIPLTDPAASTHHASLAWSGGRWEARDLGSTNGTFVDGRPLPPRETTPLARGAVLRFGTGEEEWELTDDGPPAAAARRLRDGHTRVALDGVLVLPSDDDARVSVLHTGTGQWFIDDDVGARPAEQGMRIEIAGEWWELLVPAPARAPGTYKENGGIHLSRATLRFVVSPGDKHVRLEIVEGSQVCSLRERACFFLLYELARKRLEDARAGISDAEQGWIHVIDAVDRLGKREEGQINVDIHRAKTAVQDKGIEDADQLVERRPREIRIGTGRLAIVRP